MALPSKVIEQLSRGPARTPGWSSRVLMVSSTLFLISFGTYLGITFGYQPYLKERTEELNKQMEMFKREVKPEEQEDLINFYSQISNIKKILDRQTRMRGILGWLEKNTNVNVYFSSFNFSAEGRKMTLSGRARELVNVAEQSNQIRNQPGVENLSMSGLGYDPKSGGWSFSLSIIFTPGFLKNLQDPIDTGGTAGANVPNEKDGPQDCGTVASGHLLDSSKRTDPERASLKCLSGAIISCSPASLGVSDSEGNTSGFEVIKKDGVSCAIGIIGKENKQCKVPISLLADLRKWAEDNNEPIEDIFAPVSLLISGGGGKNIQTGEDIKLECSK